MLVATGRKLAEGLPEEQRNVVVLLDGDQAFNRLNRDDFDIYWGAYLGTADEILAAGRLRDVMSDIEAVRARQAGRGWINGPYLLRGSRSE